MNTLNSISPRTTYCAVTFLTGQNFEEMVDCIMDIGFTRNCAILWSHYTISNAYLCAVECLPDENNIVEIAGPPPECLPSDCLRCAQEKYPLDEIFYQLMGYTRVGGSLINEQPFPCSFYEPMEYHPCVGANPAISTAIGVDDSANEEDSSAITPYTLEYFTAALLSVVLFSLL